MRKACLKSLFVLTVVLSMFVTPILHAANLTLTNIGSLSTDGATYSEWWYTGTSPILQGMAGEGDEVTISIDGSESKVTADSSGNWTYQTSLSAQDYSIVLTSDGESYSFTLHAGQSMSGDATATTQETTQSTSTVPPTGYNQIAGILAGTTLLAAGFYAYLQGKKSTKKAYAKEVLKSLR